MEKVNERTARCWVVGDDVLVEGGKAAPPCTCAFLTVTAVLSCVYEVFNKSRAVAMLFYSEIFRLKNSSSCLSGSCLLLGWQIKRQLLCSLA